MLFGYMRVSTKSQNDKNGEARQKEALLNYGVKEENLYYDVISGSVASRPALEEMKKYLREGDQVVVSELSRLGRSTKNTLELVEEFQQKGVSVVSLKEGMTIDNSAFGKCFLTIICAINEMEREYINERCQAGRELAKKAGKMGRPKVDSEKLKMALSLYNAKEHTVKEISQLTGISEPTIYREIKKQRNS